MNGSAPQTAPGERNLDADIATAGSLNEILVAVRRHPKAEQHGLRFVDETKGAGRPEEGLSSRLLSWREIIDRAQSRAAWIAPSSETTEPPFDLPPRVVLVFATGPLFFEALFACWFAGLVPVPIYPPQRFAAREDYAARTARLVMGCGARLVLCEERYESACLQARSLLPSLGIDAEGVRCEVLSTPGSATRPRQGRQSVSQSRGGWRRSEAEALSLVQFSSGTTAGPKPIGLSHRALIAQGRLLSACWPDTKAVRQSGVSWLPLYHDMGLIGCVLPALMRVADLTLLRPETFVARPALWLRTLSDTRATVSPAPNFAYQHCLRKVRDSDMHGLDLSCWATALNGSEPIAASMQREFWERFRHVGLSRTALTPAYGLAEAGLAVTMAPLDQAARSLELDRAALGSGIAKPILSRELGRPTERALAPENEGSQGGGMEVVSLGLPLEGFELEIRGARAMSLDEESRLLLPRGPSPLGSSGARSALQTSDAETQGPDQTPIGQLWIRGPSMLSGVLHRVAREGQNGNPPNGPSAHSECMRLEEAEQDGWFDTGDIGFLWQGELYLVGRAGDQVIVRGRNYPAAWLEHLATGVPRVEAAVVIDAGAEPFAARPAESSSAISDGGRVHAFVEARVAAGSQAEVAQGVREVLLRGAGLRLSDIVLVRPGALPRTSSGKLRRRAALRAWQRGELSGAVVL